MAPDEHDPCDSRLALVADATRAPSSHNTQPWRFHLTCDGVELYADRTRALPVNDPSDRELTISCGAALTNLVVSAAHYGWEASVELHPTDDPDHLATVDLTPADASGDDPLWDAIRTRTTSRKSFVDRHVADGLIAAALAGSAGRDVWVQTLDTAHRAAVARLVAAGDEVQFQDPAWRRELSSWMRPRRHGDGLAVPVAVGAITRLVVAHVDLGRRTGQSDGALLTAAPAVLVLGTWSDDQTAWLQAGQALQQLLLTLALQGVQAGYLNQPCQVAALRPRLSELLGRPNPQVVLRVGYPSGQSQPSARRPLVGIVDGNATSVTEPSSRIPADARSTT